MRIDGSYFTGTYPAARARPRAAAESGFAVGGGRREPARTTARQAPLLGALDSMLALQEIDDTGPRERGMQRGRAVLDLLEELKVALLEGGDDGARLDRLAMLVAERSEETGHAGLDSVLAEVDLRAQVELAKRGR